MIVIDLVEIALQELRSGANAKTVAKRYGDATQCEAAKRLEKEAPSLKQFMARQAAEKREFFKSRTRLGLKTQRATQQDHHAVIAYIFQAVGSDEKPNVFSWLRTHGANNGHPPEWAKCVARHTHSKRMKVSLGTLQDHPVINDLRDGHLFTQTHKGVLIRATYSGFAALLFSNSQIVREHRVMKDQKKELEASLVVARLEIAKANARLELSESWKSEAIAMRRNGVSCRKIADQLGKPKSTVNDYLRSLGQSPFTSAVE